MPERFGGGDYRYSFNGMEKDDEVKGKGNSYTTTFRQYDARLGRWLSIDPVTHPQFSPYSAFDNNPIYYADPSGADSEDGGDEETTLPTVEVVAPRKSIWQKIKSAWMNSDNSFTNSIKSFGKGLNNVGSTIGSGAKTMWEGVSYAMGTAWNKVVDAMKKSDEIFNRSGIHLTNGGQEGYYAVKRTGIGDEEDLDIGELVVPAAGGPQLNRFSPTKAFKKLPKKEQTQLYKDMNLLFKTIGVTIEFGEQIGEVGKSINTPILNSTNDKEIRDTLITITIRYKNKGEKYWLCGYDKDTIVKVSKVKEIKKYQIRVL